MLTVISIRGRQVIVYGSAPGLGVFVYSPTFALGNLVASMTSATKGPLGEDVVPGVAIYNGAGAVIGTMATALDALLWYQDTGSATQGGLVASIAGKAGTDSFGNSFPLGAEIFKGVFDGTDYVINSAGAFFYSGTPALGNLAVSIAPSSGTDAYGNAYTSGVSVYDSGTGQTAQLAAGELVTGNTGGSGGSGLVADGAQLTITSGATATRLETFDVSGLSTSLDVVGPASGAGSGRIWAYGWEPVAAVANQVTAGIYGSWIALVSNGSGGLVPETTHSFGPLGVTGIDITVSNYYLLPDGGVFISIKGSATGTVTAGSKTFPNALSAGYRPATGTLLPAMYGGNVASGEPRPRLVIDTSGSVTLYYPGLVSGNSISAGGRFDLQ